MLKYLALSMTIGAVISGLVFGVPLHELKKEHDALQTELTAEKATGHSVIVFAKALETLTVDLLKMDELRQAIRNTKTEVELEDLKIQVNRQFEALKADDERLEEAQKNLTDEAWERLGHKKGGK